LVHLLPAFIFALLLAEAPAAAKRKLRIELWCNGSTTDFGSVCLGSNPSSSTTNKNLSVHREVSLFPLLPVAVFGSGYLAVASLLERKYRNGLFTALNFNLN
jgi:hypothetical protein